MKKTMKIPRSFYEDVELSLTEIIHENDKEIGDDRSPYYAMSTFISRREDKLPAGVTINKVYETIFSAFFEAYNAEERRTEEDYRKKIENTISGLDDDKAYAYLATLSAMITIGNAIVAPWNMFFGKVTSEEMNAEIKRTLEGSSDKSVAERIDELIADIFGNNINAYIYDTITYDEFTDLDDWTVIPRNSKDIIYDEFTDLEDGVIQELNDVEFLSEAYGDDIASFVEQAFMVAGMEIMDVCACYGQILEGRIEGVTAENADSHVVATLYSVYCQIHEEKVKQKMKQAMEEEKRKANRVRNNDSSWRRYLRDMLRKLSIAKKGPTS